MDEFKLRYNRFEEEQLELPIKYDDGGAEQGLTRISRLLGNVAEKLEDIVAEEQQAEETTKRIFNTDWDKMIKMPDGITNISRETNSLIKETKEYFSFLNNSVDTYIEKYGHMKGRMRFADDINGLFGTYGKGVMKSYGSREILGESYTGLTKEMAMLDLNANKLFDYTKSTNDLFAKMPDFLQESVDKTSMMYKNLAKISELDLGGEKGATDFRNLLYFTQNKDVGSPQNSGKLPAGNLVMSQDFIDRMKNDRYITQGTSVEQASEQAMRLLSGKYYSLQQDINSNPIKIITPEQLDAINAMKEPLDNVKEKMVELGDETQNTGNDAEETGNKFNDWLTHTASTINRVRTLMFAIRSTFKAILNTYNRYSDYVESMNLFSVSLGSYAQEGYEWATKISDALYLDPTMVLQYTGQIYNLVEGMGIANDVAFEMSKNLSQLAIDMSSYLNIDYEAAYKKIISAISGQSRAIVTAGVPLQAASLQEFAKSIGIEKSVNKMTQAEKTMLRYIVLMKSTETVTAEASATGQEYNAMQMDLGRTLASPANAMKALNQQVANMQRSLGYLLAAVIRPMLPYLIALTRMIEKAAYAIANFFGVDTSSWKLGDTTSGLNDLSKALNDTSESGNAAAGSINRTLAAFDDLNVVENESSGSGSGSTGSILSQLYDYVKGYDILGQLSGQLENEVEAATKKLEAMGNAILGIVTAILVLKGIKWLGDTATWIGNTGTALSKISSWFKGTDANDVISKAQTTKEAVSKTGEINDTVQSKFGTLGDFKDKAAKITEAIGLLGLVILETGTLLTIIGGIMKIPGLKSIMKDGIDTCVDLFMGITKMLPGLAGLTGLATVISKIGTKDMAIGFTELALVISGTEVLITAIGALMTIPGVYNALEEGIDATVKTFEGIGKILIPLAGLTALAAVTGLGSEVILPGLGILALIIGGTEGVMAAIGAMYDKWGDSILKGLDFTVTLFKKLGECIGSLISGIGEGLSSSLPKIGENLNIFYINSYPFFNALKDMGPDTLEGAGNFVGAIAKLSTEGFISSITTILTIEPKMKAIGKALNEFAPQMVSYANTLGEISTENLDKTVNLTNAVTEFAKAAPRWGGIKQLYNGSIDLWKFGCQLAGFGGKMYDYAGHMKGVDLDIVDKSIAVAKSISEFANLSPKYNGLKQMLGGGVDLWKFGQQLAGFGGKYWDYFNNVKYVDGDIVKKSADAAESLTKFAGLSPKYSWLKEVFTGQANLWEFGKQLAGFGGKYGDYHDNIKYINFGTVEQSISSLNEIANIAKFINDNKLYDAIGKFGSKLSLAGSGLQEFFSKAKGESLGKTFGDGVANGIESALKKNLSTSIKLTSNDGLFGGNKTITTFNVKAYAEGGMPNSGDFFFANENGSAEYIASIGNRTAVANQDQMTKALADTITRAMGNVNAGQRGDVVVYIGNDKVYQGQGEYQSRQSDRYGTTYVKI